MIIDPSFSIMMLWNGHNYVIYNTNGDQLINASELKTNWRGAKLLSGVDCVPWHGWRSILQVDNYIAVAKNSCIVAVYIEQDRIVLLQLLTPWKKQTKCSKVNLSFVAFFCLIILKWYSDNNIVMLLK